MSEEAEELKFEVLERIEDAYRLPISIQIFLLLIAEMILFGILYGLHIALPEALIVFLLGTAIMYPIIIKVRNFLSELIAVVIYGCLMSSVGYYLFYKVHTGGLTKEFWMLVIFVLVFGVELFHHMYEKAKTLRTTSVYIVDIILTVIFFAASFMFLRTINVNMVWSALVSVAVALLYAYAIFPEKPY